MPNEKIKRKGLLSNVGKNQKKTMSKGNGQKCRRKPTTILTQKMIGVNVTKRWATKYKIVRIGPNEDY